MAASAARPYWKGFLSFGMINVPVRLFTTSASTTNDIKLNQIHKDCGARVQYKKVCPLHGELKAEEIVSGYEFADDQYVLFDPAELDKLRSPKDKTINIAAFIPPESVDPVYFSGDTYYLTPDGPVAQKPYTLLHKAMEKEGRWAFAQMVLRDREQIALVRPVGKLLAVTKLAYSSEVKAREQFESEVVSVEVSQKELELAKTLTDMMATDEFKLEDYADKYKENMRKLIDLKVQGKQISAAPPEGGVETTDVLNLMDALQRSVEQAKAAAGARADGKPPRQVAPSSAEKAKEAKARKRKSS